MRFVTLTNFRSGSSVFQRMLDSHPNILARQEDLRSQGNWGEEKTKRFLEELYNKEGKGHQHYCVGFKMIYAHIRPWTIKFLQDRNVKFIQLIRRDLLETALWMPGNFNGGDGGLGMGVHLEEGEKARVNIEKVVDYVTYLRQQIEEHRSIADFTIYYEDDIAGEHDVGEFWNQRKRKELLEWMGVQDRPLFANRRKNTKSRRPKSEECVANYQEVIIQLKKKHINPWWIE